MREIKVPLASGDAVLRLPDPMRELDYKLLNTYLEATKEADQARRTSAREADATHQSSR